MSENWTCNIDKRGRMIRLIIGLILLTIGVWLWFGLDDTFWSIGLFLFGLFSVFEAIRGWCVLRALGIRMPF